VTVAARIAFGVSVCSTALGADRSTAVEDSPNIVWIIAEDMSCHFGYQGQTLVHTPNVDRLAKEGVAFSNAYVSSPVCSPSRSALITGMYQTSIGVEHHYTGRGTIKHHLPAHVRLIPELFKEAGYSP
jgi:arylsulfatase A-like enzyme